MYSSNHVESTPPPFQLWKFNVTYRVGTVSNVP